MAPRPIDEMSARTAFHWMAGALVVASLLGIHICTREGAFRTPSGIEAVSGFMVEQLAPQFAQASAERRVVSSPSRSEAASG